MQLTETAPATGLALELARARGLTDRIFELVAPDRYYERPIRERHRIIFYLGHVEAFDWNQVRRATSAPAFDAGFDRLFERGIDPPEGQLPCDIESDWPSLDDVRRYVNRTRRAVDDLIARVDPQIASCMIEHRLMHAETLAYILHNDNRQREIGMGGDGLPPPVRMITIPAGSATLGKAQDSAFGWDNEYDRQQVQVPGFAISRYKVTNGEYLDFARHGAPAPHYWIVRSGDWFVRGMIEDFRLPLDWPVYVTHSQAEAYARWRDLSLPSEAQYHRAAYGTAEGRENPYPWGTEPPTPTRGNFDSVRWDPVPVTALPMGDSAFGVSQMAGNGWEWTSTVFAPFSGFKSFPFYPGYSSDFFDGEHYVLKGAGPRTDAAFLRRSFRNWFRPNYPYMHATFRLTES